MSALSKPSFEKLFDGIALCRVQGLDVPCLVLAYTGLDALAWTVYGESIPETKKRFVKFYDTYVLPISSLGCSAIDLYAARCSMLHSLGWESSLSQDGAAKSAFYSFGTDNPTTTQAAFDRFAPGRFVGIHADDLVSALIASHRKVTADAVTDRQLAERLARAEGKQYMALESNFGEQLFTAAVATFDCGEI